MTSHRTYTALFGLLMLMASPMAFAATDTVGTAYDVSAVALQQAGIIQGYEDGTVKPYGLINRVEAIKTVIEAREDLRREVEWHKANVSPLPLFADTTVEAWYTPYLEVAVKHGIVSGYPDGLLRPDFPVSASEAISMIVRAMQTPQERVYQTSGFIDNALGQWYTPYVNTAIRKNAIMHGQRLSLDTAILRGQFFDIVYRLREVRMKNLVAYAGAEPTVVQTAPVALAGASQQEVSFAISIPSLNISNLTVTHPADPYSAKGVLKPLANGVGHLFSYPGQNGKILIYGHSSGYPWDTSKYTKIFRQINKLSIGDRVFLAYKGKAYEYEVTKKKTVAVKDTSYLKADGSEELILYTCWPPDSIAQRYLVFAQPVETLAQR